MSSASVARTSKYSYRSAGTAGGSADVSIEYSADLTALSRLEDKIRLLQDDLEIERELRSRFEMNKKRDTELLKLRKLLEDVHLESEETASILKKKHQEIINDFQEQTEVYELLAQVENLNKERLISVKQVEKLEITVNELNVRIEELNRTVVDITSHKTRLSQENIELTKEVQDIKVNLENANYLKSQLAGQLEDARRRAEDDERRRQILEANLHQVEVELESVRVQLEEESEARLDLERQLVKCQGEVQVWKSKYETEAAARAEEVEELRRKFNQRIQEQEEHIESLLVKVNNLEKQKSRLQSEVEVLIIDLEKANTTARELQKRVEQLERINIDLKTRLDETVQLYEQSQRDLRVKVTELQRCMHELDKTREQKDQLTIWVMPKPPFPSLPAVCMKRNWKFVALRMNVTNLLLLTKKLKLAVKLKNNALNVYLLSYASSVTRLKNVCKRKTKRLRLYVSKVPKWRPQTKTFEYNYGYGSSFYQPMLDYLEDRDSGKKVEIPHMPWTNELGLEQFDPMKIKSYSEDELERISRKVEKSAQNKLRDYKSSASSSFVLNQSVSAATITHKVKTITKKKKAIVKEIDKLKSRMHEDLEGYNPNKDKEIEKELFSSQKYLKGKSAKAIENQLLTQSNKVIAEGLEENMRKLQKTMVTNVHDVKGHKRMMEERIEVELDENITQPLETLSHELRNFSERSTLHCIDHRELLASQKFFRGKSARAIENQLLHQSNKAIAEALEQDSKRHQKQLVTKVLYDFRGQRLLDQRLDINLGESISQPLETLSHELRNFSERSTMHCLDHRSKSSASLKTYNPQGDAVIEQGLAMSRRSLRGRSARSIEAHLLSQSKKTIARAVELDAQNQHRKAAIDTAHDFRQHLKMMDRRMDNRLERSFTEPLLALSQDLKKFQSNSVRQCMDKSKATSIEIEQLNARVVEAETRLKTEVTRIKKKLQIQITELEMSLDTANKQNIDLQKTIKKQSLTLTELQAHYDEIQRQLQVTLDQLSVSQRRAKIEQELQVVVADYDEITKELRISDERYQRVQIEAIKKSLEIEVKNLSVRLEEVEANAIVGGKRIISKLEARIRDMEAELDEEKRRHAETIKILRKKERTVKEEGVSSQSVSRVRRFQRELEAAEDRAETAESNLSLIRAKHRTFVTTSSVPGSQVYLVQETRTAEI
nr:unnamed protein product [Callosobruchus analis]